MLHIERTGRPHGRCCRAPPCSLPRVRGAAPAGYVSHRPHKAHVPQPFFVITFILAFSLSFLSLHSHLCREYVALCLLLSSFPLLPSFLLSLTTAAAPSPSCCSLSLATGSTQSSPALLSPMRTVGLCRPPLYVPSLCTPCCCRSLPVIPFQSLTPALADHEHAVCVCS